MSISQNEYEQAFETWLLDNRIQYISVDQRKRKIFARSKIKSFDFLLYRHDSTPVIAEIKGRKFRGASLAGRTGLDSWVTMDDVRGLIRWEQIFDSSCEAAFIFAYRFEKIDVEPDGREIYEFGDDRYVFYAILLDDYRDFMTVRSPKWQTVTIPAAKFREFAIPIRKLLLE
jgi:hypothetical protein